MKETIDQGMRKNILRIVVGVLGFIVAACTLSSCITRIDAGHVGIRVKLAGSARGIQNSPTVTGWIFYNPLTEEIVSFPISVQNMLWTQASNEGSSSDESITFASSEGVTVNADVGLAFHIDPTKAPRLYARFREANLMVLGHGYMRNVAREAMNEVASQMSVQELYGAGKTHLVREAQRLLTERLGPDGFVIDQLTLVSSLRLPPNVVDAINRAIEATQSAIQAENRVRQTRAEAEQAVAAARGEAEAARQRAQGEADALLIRAHAESQANQIVRLSTSAEVLQYRMLERWNGQLPVVTGGNLPMLTIDSSRFLSIPEGERAARLRELLGAGATGSAAAPAPAPAQPGPAQP